MKKTNTQKGITLVALIITIVVLLILAAVAIGAVRDSNIIAHAQNAAGGYNQAKNNEISLLEKYENEIEKNIPGDTTDQVQWAETDQIPGILIYVGDPNKLIITTDTIQVETVIANMSDYTFKRTGEVREAKIGDYTEIALALIPDLEYIDFGNSLSDGIRINFNGLKKLKEVRGLGKLTSLVKSGTEGDTDGGVGFFEKITTLETIEIPTTVNVVGKFARMH